MKEPKTNKGRYNNIIKEAEKLAEQLEKLRKKAEDLAEHCRDFGAYCDYDTYIQELKNLADTAEDLAAFDLEDSIPSRARCNF